MTAYQVMPGLTADEYEALRDDIREHGIRVPVDVDENGQVLDGHHRSLIAAELGVDCPRRVVEGLDAAGKVAHAIAVNVHRRNLTREQRRDIIAASLRAQPEVSDREHAVRTGASHPTVADVRRELEASGDVESFSTRTDASGRQQPASKPPRQQVPTGLTRITETTKSDTYVDTETGEIVEPIAEPVTDPVADAKRDARNSPFIRADKALEQIHFAYRTLRESCGGADTIVRDFHDDPTERQMVGEWVRIIDETSLFLADLRARVTRRTLRSVK